MLRYCERAKCWSCCDGECLKCASLLGLEEL